MEKILLNYIYLSEHHAGGKDQVGLNLLKGFYELGATDQFTVICFEYSVDLIKSLCPKIEIIALESRLQRNELTRMAYLTYINTTKVYNIAKNGNFKMIYHLSCNNGLRKFPISSVVIPHDIKAVAHRVLGKVKIPLYKYLIYQIMYALDFKHADGIIAISDFDRMEISQYYPQYVEKIQRIYNPIIIKNKGKWKEQGKYIVALNIQFHHKNTITLIRAFEMIQEKIPHQLVLIGRVPERMNYLLSYVKEHNLEERVKFTGFVEDEKLDQLLNGCSLYVNPTLYEGFGMTAIEAMLRGVPTLVSKVASNYEVTCKRCYYYEPADDPEELSRVLLEVLCETYDENYLEETRLLLEQRYDYRNISREYLKYFMQW